MKKYLIIFLFCLGYGFAQSQSYNYTIDPAFFNIINEATGDTMLWFTDSDNLRTQRGFRIQKNPSVGSIRMRALDNPQIKLFDADDAEDVVISTNFNGSGGAILLSDQAAGDTNSIRLVTNFGGTGDARVVTDELQINGGSDLAEMFDITDQLEHIEPGMLVSIDPNAPGKLQITDEAFDRKMAGIIAGANGIKPGILMGQSGTEAFGDHLVTLNGRAYVRANDLGGLIKVGDFLTSSPVAGEAMRVKRPKKAQGSIIGKALTELDADGLVLVLVNLQ